MEVSIKSDDPIPGQTWFCLSLLSPETVRGATSCALKIRGVYATEEEARERAKHLNSIDPAFDIYVAKVGDWVSFNTDNTTETVYQEKELQQLMDGYQNQLNEDATMIKQQIEDAKTLSKNQKRKMRNKKKKLMEKKEEPVVENVDNVDNITEMENQLKEIENMYKEYNKKSS